jgi:hypothetical protein
VRTASTIRVISQKAVISILAAVRISHAIIIIIIIVIVIIMFLLLSLSSAATDQTLPCFLSELSSEIVNAFLYFW